MIHFNEFSRPHVLSNGRQIQVVRQDPRTIFRRFSTGDKSEVLVRWRGAKPKGANDTDLPVNMLFLKDDRVIDIKDIDAVELADRYPHFHRSGAGPLTQVRIEVREFDLSGTRRSASVTDGDPRQIYWYTRTESDYPQFWRYFAYDEEHRPLRVREGIEDEIPTEPKRGGAKMIHECFPAVEFDWDNHESACWKDGESKGEFDEIFAAAARRHGTSSTRTQGRRHGGLEVSL